MGGCCEASIPSLFSLRPRPAKYSLVAFNASLLDASPPPSTSTSLL